MSIVLEISAASGIRPAKHVDASFLDVLKIGPNTILSGRKKFLQ